MIFENPNQWKDLKRESIANLNDLVSSFSLLQGGLFLASFGTLLYLLFSFDENSYPDESVSLLLSTTSGTLFFFFLLMMRFGIERYFRLRSVTNELEKITKRLDEIKPFSMLSREKASNDWSLHMKITVFIFQHHDTVPYRCCFLMHKYESVRGVAYGHLSKQFLWSFRNTYEKRQSSWQVLSMIGW